MSKNAAYALRRKMALLEVQRYRCAYCQCELTPHTATLDHIKPRCQGGRGTKDNLLAACSRCNRVRGTKDPIAFWQKVVTGSVGWRPAHLHKHKPNPTMNIEMRRALGIAAE